MQSIISLGKKVYLEEIKEDTDRKIGELYMPKTEDSYHYFKGKIVFIGKDVPGSFQPMIGDIVLASLPGAIRLIENNKKFFIVEAEDIFAAVVEKE